MDKIIEGAKLIHTFPAGERVVAMEGLDDGVLVTTTKAKYFLDKDQKMRLVHDAQLL